MEEGVLRAFRYTDYTHAYFPTERFDEIREDGWTIGRRRDGYVAMWSWRPAAWREHDPEEIFTNGLVERFELVAAGGPDNVWILELGDVERWGSFEAFCEAVIGSAIEVTNHGWDEAGAHRGFEVSYSSPAEGRLELRHDGGLSVDGEPVAIDGYPRFANPFVSAAEGEPVIRIADGVDAFVLDLAAGARTPA